MSEVVVVKHGETKVRSGNILTPSHLGAKPNRTDGSTINPYSLESISTTSALVSHGHEKITVVHKAVAEEKHCPPLPGDVTSTSRLSSICLFKSLKYRWTCPGSLALIILEFVVRLVV